MREVRQADARCKARQIPDARQCCYALQGKPDARCNTENKRDVIQVGCATKGSSDARGKAGRMLEKGRAFA
jgi:hypothetical protein